MRKISANSESFYIFIVTLFFPFIGLILSLYYWQKSWAKNIFWFVCTYTGVIFIYAPDGQLLGSGIDAGRYVLTLMNMYYDPNITLSSILSLYQIDTNHMDLYQQIITYFVSRITDNGHVLFTVFAFIFGFFYSRNMWYIFEKLPQRGLGVLYVLFGLYLLVCPITQINGVRMWTALHVFVYALLPYLVENDKSRLWLLILTPFIHFSYLYVIIFAFTYVLIPYKWKTNNMIFIYFAIIIYVISLFVNTLSLDAVSSTMAELSPESYEERIDMYVNEDYADRINEAKSKNNWYIAASTNISNWCYSIILVLLLPTIRKYFRQDRSIINLYVFTLLIGTFANIISLIPSGGRFLILSTMFKIPIISLVVSNIPKYEKIYKTTKIMCLILMLPLIVNIRKIFDFYGITILFGNFMTAFFWESNVPLITFIKSLFF